MLPARRGVLWLHLAGHRCARVCAGAPWVSTGSEALGPCPSSPEGLLFSLTQVTFQPYPLLSFSALPEREGASRHLLRAAFNSRNSPSSHSVSPSHSSEMPQPGAT